MPFGLLMNTLNSTAIYSVLETIPQNLLHQEEYTYYMNEEVEAYLARFDGEVKKRLTQLRVIVRTEAPEAIEAFSYGLIGYKMNGKPLVYFGGFKNHVGFYATPNGHKAFAEEFSKYKQGKGSVQFPLDQALPVDLLRRVIAYRKESVA